MRSLLASLLFVSFSAFGNDIIKIIDGSSAVCKTKADVFRYQASGVYRPVSFERGTDAVVVTVEFLRCIEREGEFKFVRDDKFENRVVSIQSGPFSRENLNVEIKRSEIGGVSYSTRGRIYSQSPMRKNADNTYSQKIPGGMENLEADGDDFFEFTVSYKEKVINQATDEIIDSKQEYLGSYRIYVK